jgi:mono/diheme cytochrome c family protein
MNKAIQLIALTALGCSSMAVNADAVADKDKLLKHGEKMLTDHCYKCHTDSVYMRDNRAVKSLNALTKQVVRCKDNTGAPWFDEDTDAVVHFLNEKYYKF